MTVLTWRTKSLFLVSRLPSPTIFSWKSRADCTAAQKGPSVRIKSKCPSKERYEENEIDTKDPNRRGQCACEFVSVRMQPTRRDNQRNTVAPGGRRPIDATDNGAGSHQQPDGLHDGFTTTARDLDADFPECVADGRTPACYATIKWKYFGQSRGS